MKIRAFVAVAAFTTLLAASVDKGLTAYIIKRGASRQIVSYYMLQRIHDEPGDFLWAHYDGEEYVIREKPVLDRIDALVKTVPDFDKEKDVLDDQLAGLEQERDQLESRRRSATGEKTRRQLKDSIAAVERKVSVVNEKVDALATKRRDAENNVAREIARIVDKAVRAGTVSKAK